MNSIKLFTANVKLTATEEYLLNWINDKPDLFIEYKTQEIAKAANCSTSAITRLARKLDYPSLKKMQIKAQEKMSEIKDNYQIISENNLSANIVNLNTYHSYAIKETLTDIDLDVIQWIVERILISPRIILFGVGSSKRACQELATNLIKIGFNVIFYEDIHIQLLNVPMLTKDDLVIMFSKNCQTREIRFLIDACYEYEIPSVVFTSNKNFLQKEKVTKVLTFVTYEQSQRITAISSKIAQLIISDLIYTEVFNHDYQKNISLVEHGTNLIAKWNTYK
jgi:RpiR family carbohydrate utilization transcriptional regulator